MSPLIYICLDFHQKYVFHRPLHLYVLEVQHSCQWLHYENLGKIRTYYEPIQPDLEYSRFLYTVFARKKV